MLHEFQFFDKSRADEWCEVEVECRDGLSAVHLVLCYFERDACKYCGCFDALGGTAFAMPGNEALLENAVEGMLHACEALGGVVILVVDVYVA